MIVIGLLVSMLLMRRDPYKFLTDEQLYGLITGCIVSGIAGCRILFILTTPDITLWETIFSLSGGAILGGVIAIILFVLWFAWHTYQPAGRKSAHTELIEVSERALQILDLVGLYGPLIYTFGRTGCFFAGCCYGLPTTLPWAVTYTHEESAAPLCIALHPSQLYSAASLLVIFLFLYWIRPKLKHPGQLIALSVFLLSVERFVNDFFREEHGIGLISPMQWIAVAMAAVSAMMFLITARRKG